MNMNPLILMVSPSAANFASLRRAVAEGGYECQLQRADDVPMALARVAGGGVKLVLLDVSGPQNNTGNPDGLRKFHETNPGLPVALWSDSEDPGLQALAAQAGAAGCVTNANSSSELQRIVTVAIRNTAAIRNGETAKPGVPETLINPATATVIAVMGVKGGVGATTVAMNVAATLVGRGRVVLAEIRPGFGSLQGHFCPGRLVRGLTSLLDSDPQAPVARAVTSVLWPVPTVSGLRVLFGPQTEADCREMGPAQITAILQALAAEADFVVVDLPVSLFEANRAILAASHYLALVLEPAPACMKLGKLIVEGIQSWEKTPASIGAVIVNRTSEGAPVPITEIEAELGVPVLKAVPPAPDLYLQGERAHAPMVLCDPDSLVADSFVALARSFHSCGALYNRAS